MGTPLYDGTGLRSLIGATPPPADDGDQVETPELADDADGSPDADATPDDAEPMPGTTTGNGWYEADDGTRWRGKNNAPDGYTSVTEA